MRVGYTKVGRSQGYTPANWGPLGADNEAPMLLNRLARRYPDVEFVLLGHNDGFVPGEVGLPSNVVNPFIDLKEDTRAAEKHINVQGTPPPEQSLRYIESMREIWKPWYDSCSSIVAWIGQNDTINQPIPKIDGSEGLGNSRMIYIRNCSYHFSIINSMRDERGPHNFEPVWLCSDVWNVLKARDLKWPYNYPVLSQYNFTKKMTHWRYGDTRSPEECGFIAPAAHWHPKHPGCWESELEYVYSGLELGCSVPQTEFDSEWSSRGRFGVIINQSRAISGRDEVLSQYVRPLWPDWIFGSWDSNRAPDISPFPWGGIPQLLKTVRCGLAVPIKKDHSWATPKAWEMFAGGTVCFFHPRYDTQGHIIPTLAEAHQLPAGNTLRELALWLRVENPGQLRKRVDHLNINEDAWQWIVHAQRAVYNVAREEQRCLNMIGHRLGVSSLVSAA